MIGVDPAGAIARVAAGCHRIPVTHRDDALVAATTVMNGQPHELRAIGGGGAVYSGVFATPDELAEVAHELGGSVHCYLGLNPTTLAPHDIGQVGSARASRTRRSRGGLARRRRGPRNRRGRRDQRAPPREIGFPEAGVFGSSGRGCWLL
jgi:hypothetical protein